jgi:hypothetical protein
MLLGLSLPFYVLYQLTLAATSPQPYPNFWYFSGDNYQFVFTKLLEGHPMAFYQAHKHPLFAAVNLPVYLVGRLLFGALPEPYAGNLALSFPSAIFGGLNVYLAYLLFRRIGFRTPGAILTALLFGFGASHWYFASYPETYVFTSFVTNLFLVALLADPTCRNWKRLVALNALACFAAPQQILLAIIPAYAYLSQREGARIRSTIRYGVALFLLYVIPFVVQLTITGSKVKLQNSAFVATEFVRWSSVSDLINPGKWFVVFFVFTVFGEFFPPVRAIEFTRVTWSTITAAPYTTWVPVLLVAGYVAWGYAAGKRTALPLAPGFLICCLSYVCFFVYFSSHEAFLFSPPIILLFWLLFHAGHVAHQDTTRWRATLVFAVLFTVINNGALISQLRHSDEKLNSKLQIDKASVWHG